MRRLQKNKLYSVGAIAVAILCIGVLAAITVSKEDTPKVTIPSNISSGLLFTPYLPTKLPKDYTIDQTSFSKKEDALLFSAVNDQGTKILFSEQAVPKSFDITQFYSSSIDKPTRLSGLKNQVVYGKLKGQQNSITGITTSDSTWVLVIGSTTKEEAIVINQGLTPQN